MIVPNIWKNKNWSKPPASMYIYNTPKKDRPTKKIETIPANIVMTYFLGGRPYHKQI